MRTAAPGAPLADGVGRQHARHRERHAAGRRLRTRPRSTRARPAMRRFAPASVDGRVGHQPPFDLERRVVPFEVERRRSQSRRGDPRAAAAAADAARDVARRRRSARRRRRAHRRRVPSAMAMRPRAATRNAATPKIAASQRAGHSDAGLRNTPAATPAETARARPSDVDMPRCLQTAGLAKTLELSGDRCAAIEEIAVKSREGTSD